jgi:hypothetical protein
MMDVCMVMHVPYMRMVVQMPDVWMVVNMSVSRMMMHMPMGFGHATVPFHP